MLTKQEIIDRKQFIGGSDIGIILGLSSYKTPYMLYLEKIGAIAIDDTMTEEQEWGHRIEPVLRLKFEETHGVKAPQRNKVVHPTMPFIRCNLDGWVEEWNAVWEGKNSSIFMKDKWGEHGSTEQPYPYVVQVAMNCSATNADMSYSSVLIGGNRYKEIIYKRDIELESMLLNFAWQFRECVESRREPAPINMDDCRIKYEKPSKDKKILANDDVLFAYAKLGGYKEERKRIEELEAKAKIEIMEYMKDCEVLMDSNGDPLTTWKANAKGTRVFLTKGI